MTGKHFELKDSLKISARGIANISANVFNILTLGLFKPGILLVFNSLNLFATDSLETIGSPENAACFYSRGARNSIGLI